MSGITYVEDPEIEARYLETGGTVCPFCGSGEISETGGGQGDFTHEMKCDDCQAIWLDQVKVIGMLVPEYLSTSKG